MSAEQFLRRLLRACARRSALGASGVLLIILGLLLVSLPSFAAQSVYTATGTPVAIPDNDSTGVGVPIVVSGFAGPITGIRVAVDLQHLHAGDVALRLTSPSGTLFFDLVNRVGLRPGGVVGSNLNYDGVYTFVDEKFDADNLWEAAPSYGDTNAVIPSSDYWMTRSGDSYVFPVLYELGNLSDASINGTWTLTARDYRYGTYGTLRGVQLTLISGERSHALTVAVSGNGVGSVSAGTTPTPTSGGIADCTKSGGAVCSAVYADDGMSGASVTLTASAGGGSQFTGWGGACSGAAITCTVTMDQAHSVTATFALMTYTVTGIANPVAGGEVSCVPASVTHGSRSTCTANAKPGYAFSSFSGDCTGDTCVLSNIQADMTVTARFLNTETGFNGTTVPPEGGSAGPASASFTGGGTACSFDMESTGFIAAPAAPPAGKVLPQGMFKFKLVGCDETPVTMSVTWPEPVTGYTKYGKATANAESSYFAPTGLAIDGNTVSFTVQDGQFGDDDWTVNGDIVDPSGPLADVPVSVAVVTPVPTLGEWGLMLLGLLAAGLGMRRLRRTT